MLTIPKERPKLDHWVREIADACMHSRAEREGVYARNMSYYERGTAGNRAAIYNLIRPFVERLAGYLFSPRGVRFYLEFDNSQPVEILMRAEAAGTTLSREFRETDADMVFSAAVQSALIRGASILKIWPDTPGFDVGLVQPEYFGVLREDIEDLERQDAVCHVSYPTVDALRDMLAGRPDEEQILAALAEASKPRDHDDSPGAAHQLFVGALNPISGPGGGSSAAGIVSIYADPAPSLSPMVNARIIELRELWVRDRERGGCWTTLQMAGDILIEGATHRRNRMLPPDISDADSPLQQRLPFVRVCPFPVPGSFFGCSLVPQVQMLQDAVSKRLRNIVKVADLQAKPPVGISGYPGVTEAVYNKLMSEGGVIRTDQPNARIQPFAPQLPPDQWTELQEMLGLADRAAGMPAVLRGEGEAGVRAQGHAETLVRTASPRLLVPAAQIERQLADVGLLAFLIMQMEDGREYRSEAGEQFLLKHLPGDYRMSVDPASASPAFAAAQETLTLDLLNRGVISGEDAIRMLNLPMADLLIANLKRRAAALAHQQAQQAAQHGNVVEHPSRRR